VNKVEGVYWTRKTSRQKYLICTSTPANEPLQST